MLVIWMVNTAHAAFITYTIYFYAVTNFSDPMRLKFFPWSPQRSYSNHGAECLIRSLLLCVPSLSSQRKKEMDDGPHHIPNVLRFRCQYFIRKHSKVTTQQQCTQDIYVYPGYTRTTRLTQVGRSMFDIRLWWYDADAAKSPSSIALLFLWLRARDARLTIFIGGNPPPFIFCVYSKEVENCQRLSVIPAMDHRSLDATSFKKLVDSVRMNHSEPFTKMDSSTATTHLHLSTTLGAVFLGNIALAVLYGTSTLQTWIYFNRFRDTLWLRILIFVIWTMATIHAALITYSTYYYSVINFSNPAQLYSSTWYVVPATGESSLLWSSQELQRRDSYDDRQCGAHPLYLCIQNIPSQRKKGLADGTYNCTYVIRLQHEYRQPLTTVTEIQSPAISHMMYIIFIGIVIVEGIIATSLSVVLWRLRTGIMRTDGIIRTIIAYSVNAGVLTSLCSLSILITYATMPNNYVCVALYFVMPESSFNSLLASLNARRRLRDDALWNGTIEIPLSTMGSRPFSAVVGTTDHGASVQPIAIQVETTTSKKTDSMSHFSRLGLDPSQRLFGTIKEDTIHVV
ncbi:hypothetical protein NM688_g2213 [Phlebia brevispora]|uniref:Uncharacterized protein n=1 Tax=Phlebia brevispora TaxID=194682 RepID=A0ACC1T9K9_9APHY|nr:hypothetical protein NM688_g2213 [Phlebia brevispora]